MTEHVLTFNEVPNVTSYRMYLKRDPSAEWPTIPWLSCPGSPCTVRLVTPLPSNTIYFSLTSFRVGVGESIH